MSSAVLAILSDIHVGGARARDLCPYSDRCETDALECPYAVCEARDWDQQFVDRFTGFVEEEGIRPTHLLLLGDVTSSGQPDEVELASRVMERIRSALGVTSEQVVFVPGNHDVDWAVCRLLDYTGVRESQRFTPISHEAWQFSCWQAQPPHADLSVFKEPYISVWETSDVVVVGFNSSWADRESAEVHHGEISEGHVAALSELLQTHHEHFSDRLRVFALHHHPLQYDNPFPDDPDFSIMEGMTSSLLDALHSHSFSLIVHGHRHRPFLSTSYRQGLTIPVFGAGSFSVPPMERWGGRFANAFHVVEVGDGHSFDPLTGETATRGKLRTWGYQPIEGWVPSRPEWGIHHADAFGTYPARDVLKSTILNEVATQLSATGRARWTEVLAQHAELEYSMRSDLEEVLDSLIRENGWERFEDEEATDFVILEGT